MSDWFRNKTWTTAIESEFFTKLSRAREYSRAQYLKIQAIELIETGDLSLLEPAETLLNKVLTEYPENETQRSMCLSSLGDIYRLRRNLIVALDFYKMAVDFEEIFPNVQTNAYLDLTEMAIRSHRKDLYEVCESLIAGRAKHALFNVANYRGYSFLSVINFRNGNFTAALQYADAAERYASLTSSGLQYHKSLGVVTLREAWLDELIAGYKNMDTM
jgi:tetratricopeptide (TPR) repeat protein